MDKSDFLVDENGNYKVALGDLVIGPCLKQEVLAIVRANQGDYKHYPLVGCNIIMMANSQKTTADVERELRQQLTAAGIDYASVVHMID